MAKKTKCSQCGKLTPDYDIINLTGLDRKTRILCTRCFNAEMAAVDPENDPPIPDFEPYVVKGKDNRKHTFHIRGRFGPVGITLEAFEVIKGEPGGYEFAVFCDFDADIFDAYVKLIHKIRKGLSVLHIEKSNHGPQINYDTGVRGRITWDEKEDGQVPMIVIDGKEYSWSHFGHMLMTFQGFQFRLTIHDRSDDV